MDDALSITVYPGADGAFSLYEDDGRTFNYRNGAWTRLAMTWNNASRRFSLRAAPGSRMPARPQRQVEVRVAGEQTSRRVVFVGRPIDLRL